MCVGACFVGLLFVCFCVYGRGNKETNENKQTQESRVRLLEYHEAHKWYMRNTPPKYIRDAPFTFPSIPVMPEHFFAKTAKGQMPAMLKELYASQLIW